MHVILGSSGWSHEILKALHVFHQQEEYCDVVVVCNDKKIRAHSCVLAAASPWVASVLQCGSSEGPVQIVSLEDTSSQVVQYIMTYVYTGQVKVPFKHLKSVQELVSKLRIKGLDSDDNEEDESADMSPSNQGDRSDHSNHGDSPTHPTGPVVSASPHRAVSGSPHEVCVADSSLPSSTVISLNKDWSEADMTPSTSELDLSIPASTAIPLIIVPNTAQFLETFSPSTAQKRRPLDTVDQVPEKRKRGWPRKSATAISTPPGTSEGDTGTFSGTTSHQALPQGVSPEQSQLLGLEGQCDLETELNLKGELDLKGDFDIEEECDLKGELDIEEECDLEGVLDLGGELDRHLGDTPSNHSNLGSSLVDPSLLENVRSALNLGSQEDQPSQLNLQAANTEYWSNLSASQRQSCIGLGATILQWMETSGQTGKGPVPSSPKERKKSEMDLLDTDSHDVPPDKSFACSKCPYKASRRKNLTKHTRRVHGPKAFTCQHCNQSFGLEVDAIRHAEIHSDREFLCPTCGKSFKSTGGLREHTKLKHSGLAFKCQICEKTFVRECLLTYHMDSYHDKVKLHKCQYCPKSYGTPNTRRQHEIICEANPNTQSHKCLICGRIFKRNTYLQNHMKGKHSSKQSACETPGCKETFNWPSSLTRHRKKCGQARKK